jgi:hypothetical protein
MNDFAKMYIISYKKNGKWNDVSNISINRFHEQGFRTELIEGYNLKDSPEIKRNHIVYLNLLDKVLNVIKKRTIKDGFFIAEDDAFPADFVTPAFLKKRLSKLDYKNTIVRVGYQKVLNEKRSGYPRKYYCVGTQLIWIPKNLIPKLEEVMKQVNAQHLNGFFSKTIDLPVELLDKKVQIDKRHKYILEVEHASLTMDKTRKGKRESSIERDKKKSTKQKFFSNLNTVRSVAFGSRKKQKSRKRSKQ